MSVASVTARKSCRLSKAFDRCASFDSAHLSIPSWARGLEPFASDAEHVAAIIRAQAGDKIAHQEVVLRNLGLVRSRVLKSPLLPRCGEDLYQEGVEGLISAIKGFDAAKGVKFGFYAVLWIDYRLSRVSDDTIKVPVQRGKDSRKIRRAEAGFHSKGIAAPSSATLAEITGMDVDSVSAQKASTLRVVSSVSYTSTVDGEDGERDLFNDAEASQVRSVEVNAESSSTAAHVRAAVLRLPERYRGIVMLRSGVLANGDGLSFAEIGRIRNSSRERIRQLYEEGLALLARSNYLGDMIE